MKKSRREHQRRGLLMIVLGLTLFLAKVAIEGGLSNFSYIGVLLFVLGVIDLAYGRLAAEPADDTSPERLDSAEPAESTAVDKADHRD